MNTDKYLYEIIDEYKEADSDKEKDLIFKSLCTAIWSSDNKRRLLTRTLKFKVRNDLLETEQGKVFDAWSEVEYKSYNPVSSKTDWSSIIRQKINNVYTRYFDKEVVLNKEYMDLLNTPKRLYYRWINGEEMDAEKITELIDDAIDNAVKTKNKYQMQKMILPWNEYKKLIDSLLKNIMERCKTVEEYNFRSGNIKICNYTNEDCTYVSYFCKSIEYEMMKWQKKYYGVREHKKYKRCKICGRLIENTGNKKMYCTDCAKEKERQNAVLRKRRQRERDRSRNKEV
ncbi:MAG: hypothetical protein HDT48_03230 [Ruminococcaceae bacterium]|nr:hypothetical protein [Oscillospiraceae bacterium]